MQWQCRRISGQVEIIADLTAVMNFDISLRHFFLSLRLSSIKLTILEPMMTPSAPDLATFAACSGVLMPKPTLIHLMILLMWNSQKEH